LGAVSGCVKAYLIRKIGEDDNRLYAMEAVVKAEVNSVGNDPQQCLAERHAFEKEACHY
jgi:hypothetical protein